MARMLHVLLLGLVGAGLAHIAILLMIPVFSERDAWARVSALGPAYAMLPLGVETPIPAADPMFDTAACRFDLADGVTRIRADGKVPYWSLSVFNRRNESVYSLNDRTSAGAALDVVVATPVQIIELRKDMPADYESAVFIEADIAEGMVVLRAFVPDDSWRPGVARWFAGASCIAD